MSRAPRRVAAGLLLAVAASSLAACRTSPDVAAYVGDDEVTVAELEAAVDARLDDEDIAGFAAASEAAYTRRVLTFLIQQEVYEAVAERYDVGVGDPAVSARIGELMGADEPDDVYRQLAQRGVSRADVAETIRQQLLRREIAADDGDPLSEDALRESYAEQREELALLEFGYITVPDEATATAVLAELSATPADYPAIAARYPGTATLPELARRGREGLPPVLAEELTAAAPGTGFTQDVPDVGVVVGFTTGVVYPSFEELRPELEAAVADRLDGAGAELADEVRDDLDVTVNPRYGVLTDDGRVTSGDDGGVVEILGDDAGVGGRGD